MIYDLRMRTFDYWMVMIAAGDEDM